MEDELLGRRRSEIVKALIAAEEALDFEALAEVFPHPRYELIGNGRVYDGAAVCTRYLKERHNAFPDYAVELIAIYHAPTASVAEAWITGTHVGRIEGIEPTQRGFRVRMASFFLFEDDRLTCVRNYFDHATIARQLA